MQKPRRNWKGVVRKTYGVLCQDFEVDDKRSWVSSQVVWVDKPLRVKHTCVKQCNEKKKGFTFDELEAIVTEAGGMPHTINLCKDCYDYKLEEKGESNARHAGWIDLIRQITSRGKLCGTLSDHVLSKESGSDAPSKKGGQSMQKWCSWKQTATGKMNRLTRRNLTHCEQAMTWDWRDS